MNDTLEKYFKVSVENTKPFYVQVMECLENFIIDHQAGDKIPSENALASFLKVNRETVRKAIMSFVENGILARSQKGTFIAKRGEQNISTEPHPLMFQNIFLSPKTTHLKLALYENLPKQKTFWNETISTFKKVQPHIKIHIEWVPNEVRNMEKYCDYLLETKPDIFQMPGLSEELFKQKGLLADPSEAIREKLNSDDYWDCDSHLSIPIHFSGWGIFWNKSLVKKYGLKNVKERIVSGKILDVFHEAATLKKDNDVFISGMIWNYLCSLGIPDKEHISTEKFFQDRLLRIKDLNNIFVTREKYALEGQDSFFDEKTIFYITTNWFVSNYLDNITFPLGVAWNIPEKGSFCSSPPSSLGIYNNKDNAKTDAAAEYIDFLLSSAQQELLAKSNLNCAVMKDANKHFMRDQSDSDFQCLIRSFNTLSASKFVLEMNNFLTYDMRDLYVDLLNQKINYTDAAKEADKRWKA